MKDSVGKLNVSFEGAMVLPTSLGCSAGGRERSGQLPTRPAACGHWMRHSPLPQFWRSHAVVWLNPDRLQLRLQMGKSNLPNFLKDVQHEVQSLEYK